MNTTKPGYISKNDDCYFYYYGSGCAKGSSCPFRHEPTALAQETVCTYWKQGNCIKPHCIFRHMDLAKKRNVIPCYWEKTTVGCQKAHCPFLHDNPKDSPLTEPVIQNLKINDCSTNQNSIGVSKQLKSLDDLNVLKTEPDVSKIIVNKNKIEELKSNHVLPQDISAFTPVTLSMKCEAAKKNESNRVVLPPKSRLGIKIEISEGNKRSVKERLGRKIVDAKHNCKIYELEEGDSLLEDNETDVSLEEKRLREGAIKTMDLRNRLSKKDTFLPENRLQSIIQSQSHDTQENNRLLETCSDPPMTSGMYGWKTDDHTDPESYSETDEEYDTVPVPKKSKKPKKEKKKKEKSKKKEKKEYKAEKLKHKKLKAEKAKKKMSSKNKHSDTNQSTNDNEMVPEDLELEDLSTLELYVRNLKKEKKKMLQNEIDELVSEQVGKSEHNETAKNKSAIGCDKARRSSIAKDEILHKGKASMTSHNSNQQKEKKRKIDATSTKGIASKAVLMPKTSYSNKRAKILKNISNAVVKKKESVRSILNDVDSLLKSAENQNLLDAKDNIQAESDDVMKQLDEIINS